MSFAHCIGRAILVACAVSVWPAQAWGGLPDPRGGDSGAASTYSLPGPFVPSPQAVDFTGYGSGGYRSFHFEDVVNGSSTVAFVFPFHVTVDNDTFFVSDYSGNFVQMHQIVAGGVNYIRSFGGTSGTGPGQFSGPAQMAVVGNSLYVADYFNSRIQRFDKTTGAYVSQFGTNGSGAGQLSGPSGLVYNPVNGLLYVSETGNDRIQAFTTSGTYQFGFSSLGSGNGQLNNPFGLGVDSVGNIYVADTSNNRVSKFDLSGLWLRNIAVGATMPYAVSLDKGDNVWVTFGNGDVYAYSSTDGFLSYYYGAYGTPATVANGYIQTVRGVAVTAPLNIAPFNGAPAIIVADGGSHNVQLFSHSAQPNAHPAMDSITGLGGYNFGIAYDNAENVYVTSYNADIVYKFDKFGALITQWGSFGTGNGQFNGLMGIAVDDSNNVYVADRNNNRIQKFNSSGGYISQWGTLGTGDGQFNHPSGVATDGLWLYVAEENNNRVQKFSLTGTYVRKWGTTGTGSGQFSSPEGIAVDRTRNQVYVVEYSGSRIQQFSVFGDFIKVLADSTSGLGQLSGPLGLGIDQRGNLYCGDLGNNRVVQYSDQGTYLGIFPVPQANGVAVDRNGQVRVGVLSSGTVGRFGATLGKSDTIGVYRPSNFTFYLRNSLTVGAPNITATVTGAAVGDIPLTGDWDGDSIDTPGLYRPGTSTFYLWDKWRGLDVATAPYQFSFGLSGDKPFVGDWDGDGRDGVGVFRASNTTQYLKNKLIAGSPDYSVIFGLNGDLPVGGDWNQDGNYSAGIYRPVNGTFYLTNRNATGGAPTERVVALGNPTDLPLAGDWTHNGSSSPGIFRAGTFYLVDNQGNLPADTVFRDGFEPVLITVGFGLDGDIPLGGTWGQAPE